MEVSFNRKSYHFTPENNKTLDIQEKEIINYIFSLPNRAEFEAVVDKTDIVEEVKPIPLEDKKEKPIIKKRGRPKKRR